MAPIPRYRPHEEIVILSAGFRPFFLLAALWACAVVPASVGFISGAIELPTAFPPLIWHVHEMVFGYGSAVVAGFLLTAIPNWTGRLPLQGGPLAALLLAWFCGRNRRAFFPSSRKRRRCCCRLDFPGRISDGGDPRNHRGSQLAQSPDGRRAFAIVLRQRTDAL